MDLPTIRQATQLWLAPSQTVDISDNLARLNAGNMARDDMLAGKISVDDYLDVLSDLGLEIDSICQDFENNLEVLIGDHSVLAS